MVTMEFVGRNLTPRAWACSFGQVPFAVDLFFSEHLFVETPDASTFPVDGGGA
jgi:hypothetical protein